ncbi:hypothetical protein [Photobacterium leiognathi]|uniref:Uncharacterized protein n=1 Tax=Photobacterium leiognathi TaxID=553611 RepID=A0ABX5GAZ4_PHOLE|nr:hypothetical protein [Photobacterium leiognathi]KJF86552.1 hypothetical protein UB42_18705 [Photobacterium leiognathi]PSV78220.1 hypothetical protein CTM94_19630 [Photobacterium leiognathi]
MITKQNYDDVMTNMAKMVETTFNAENMMNISVTLSVFEDTEDAANWPDVTNQKDGYGNMDWKKIYDNQRNKSKHFMLSVHSSENHQNLAMLFAGHVSANDDDGSCVSLDYIERNSEAVELKGYAIVLAIKFAYVLAELISFKRVKVNNPARGLGSIYQKEMPNSEWVQYGKTNYIHAEL